jgi:hypothetical protein
MYARPAARRFRSQPTAPGPIRPRSVRWGRLPAESRLGRWYSEGLTCTVLKPDVVCQRT